VGAVGIYTEFAIYVSDFNARARLAKLGYSDSLDDLDDKEATIFLEISGQYDKLDTAKAKQKVK